MSDIRSPVRIGDDAAVLDLVPLASDMPTVEDLRMVLAAYRIRGMLGFLIIAISRLGITFIF